MTMAADRWLTALLSNDATLMAQLSGVHADFAPQGAAYPFVVISQVDGMAVTNAYADVIMDTENWQVALVTDKASYAGLEAAVERVRALLHKASGTGVLVCVYKGMQRMAEQVNGKVYRQIVLEFEISTQ